MTRLLLLFLAGGLGTLARFGLAGLVQRWSGDSFPAGTFLVNVLGCLLFGFVFSLAEQRQVISGETRFLLLTGFMGAFTTFSTFAYETTALGRDSEWLLAGLNLIGQIVLGIVAMVLGLTLGRMV